MNKPCPARPEWTRPQLKPLGTLRDVAGAELNGTQAANGKKS